MEKKVWIPAERFLEVLDCNGIGNDDLDRAGVRRVWELRNGRQEAVSLDVADRLFAKLGLTDWFHLPREKGGLADLYFGEETFTPSWVPRARAHLAAFRTAAQSSKTKKCACGAPILSRSTRCVPCYRESMRGGLTREELQARRRARYVEWSRRQGKRCECGTLIVDSSTRCRACYNARKTQAPHGTRSRYTAGCRCMECRRAEADYARDYKRKLRAEYLEAQAAA